MTAINVYNLEKKKTSEMELNEAIFNIPVKKHLLHQVVVSQLNNNRTGCASTKTRSEVKGSGKKLFRQKGTGNARAGNAASPTRRGGGIAFGPSPKIYNKKILKKVRKSAISMALSDKLQTDKLVIVEAFEMKEIKTKSFIEVMSRFDINKALIITHEKNINLEKSSRNVPWVKVMRSEGINVYDILQYDYLFLLKQSVNKIEEALIS